jgi:hypothetical protein
MVNPQQRELVTAVAQRAPDPGAVTNDEIKGFTSEIQGLGLPIGWTGEGREWTNRLLPSEGDSIIACVLAWLMLATGYMITAFAVMLGAPFWFDTLNRIMVIRATVKPKEKSPDEPSEEGGVPQPPPPPLAPKAPAPKPPSKKPKP